MIGERLKELRILNNLTQEQIAKYINCQQSCYAKYERNELNIPIISILKICKLYSININEIINERYLK